MTRSMSFSKKVAVATSVSLMLMLQATMLVRADGNETKDSKKTKEVCVTQYGGGTDCHTEVISEEVVHDTTTIDAGLGDVEFTTMAAILATTAGALYLLSLITQNVSVLKD